MRAIKFKFNEKYDKNYVYVLIHDFEFDDIIRLFSNTVLWNAIELIKDYKENIEIVTRKEFILGKVGKLKSEYEAIKIEELIDIGMFIDDAGEAYYIMFGVVNIKFMEEMFKLWEANQHNNKIYNQRELFNKQLIILKKNYKQWIDEAIVKEIIE